MKHIHKRQPINEQLVLDLGPVQTKAAAGVSVLTGANLNFNPK